MLCLVMSENRVHLGCGVCVLILKKIQIYHLIITLMTYESLRNSSQKRGVAGFFGFFFRNSFAELSQLF